MYKDDLLRRQESQTSPHHYNADRLTTCRYSCGGIWIQCDRKLLTNNVTYLYNVSIVVIILIGFNGTNRFLPARE